MTKWVTLLVLSIYVKPVAYHPTQRNHIRQSGMLLLCKLCKLCKNFFILFSLSLFNFQYFRFLKFSVLHFTVILISVSLWACWGSIVHWNLLAHFILCKSWKKVREFLIFFFENFFTSLFLDWTPYFMWVIFPSPFLFRVTISRSICFNFFKMSPLYCIFDRHRHQPVSIISDACYGEAM